MTLGSGGTIAKLPGFVASCGEDQFMARGELLRVKARRLYSFHVPAKTAYKERRPNQIEPTTRVAAPPSTVTHSSGITRTRQVR